MIKWETESKDIQRKMTEGNKNGPENRGKEKRRESVEVRDQIGFPGGTGGKEYAWQCRRHESRVQSLGLEDPLEEEMVTCSSTLAWEISWTEEPGGLQSMGLQRAGHY